MSRTRCEICGNQMRLVHHKNNNHWCWNCEPYRPGSNIQTTKINKIETVINRVSIEFLKALVFIVAGYGWAVTAYGVFPR